MPIKYVPSVKKVHEETIVSCTSKRNYLFGLLYIHVLSSVILILNIFCAILLHSDGILEHEPSP